LIVKRLTLLKVLLGGMDKLESNELKATILEAGDDLADESTLDTVGLQVNLEFMGSIQFQSV
jgi:hypothetical protein